METGSYMKKAPVVAGATGKALRYVFAARRARLLLDRIVASSAKRLSP
jgi:hypothetical protein